MPAKHYVGAVAEALEEMSLLCNQCQLNMQFQNLLGHLRRCLCSLNVPVPVSHTVRTLEAMSMQSGVTVLVPDSHAVRGTQEDALL